MVSTHPPAAKMVCLMEIINWNLKSEPLTGCGKWLWNTGAQGLVHLKIFCLLSPHRTTSVIYFMHLLFNVKPEGWYTGWSGAAYTSSPPPLGQYIHYPIIRVLPGGVLDLNLGREVLPLPWDPDPVYDKKFMKIMENWYPVYDFPVKFHSFFRQSAWFLNPVYRKSLKLRPCLWADGRKTIPWRAARPRITNLCMEYPRAQNVFCNIR